MHIHYVEPEPASLRALKVRLEYSGRQMSELFDLASSQQWHKYCLENNPRPMSLGMLVLAAIKFLGPKATVAQVFDWCREAGATITITA